MADTKISALTSATTPLAGTEVLPIVQSSTTVKVAVNDLTVRNVRAAATTGILQVSGPTAGTTRTVTVPDANFTAARTDAAQSFTGDQTLSTGNLIQGTAATGYNFTANTPAAGMTSQLLNWYEEGSYTPQLLGGTTNPTITYQVQSGYYTRVGRLVTCQIYVQISAAIGGSGTLLVNLPFTANAANQGSGSCAQYNITYTGTQLSAVVTSGAANLSFLGQTTNSAWTQLTTANLKAAAVQAFSITVSYFV
jgi:hypothetical protein